MSATETKKIAYLALRRQGRSQADARERTGVSRTSSFRYDRDAGLNSPMGPATKRKSPKDPKIFTDDTALSHVPRAPVPGAEGLTQDPGNVLHPRPPAHPSTEDEDRLLAIPDDLRPDPVNEALALAEELSAAKRDRRSPIEQELQVELVSTQTARDGDAEILAVFDDTDRGTFIKRESGSSEPYPVAEGSYRAGLSLDLTEMGVGYDGIPQRPEVFAPQRRDPLAAARARREAARDRWRTRP
jgi:hypothetical protein